VLGCRRAAAIPAKKHSSARAQCAGDDPRYRRKVRQLSLQAMDNLAVRADRLDENAVKIEGIVHAHLGTGNQKWGREAVDTMIE
jgi:hypothetical protein